MTEQEYEAARLARNEWARRYRREHPDRIKETNARYYLKKAAKMAEQDAQAADGKENPAR